MKKIFAILSLMFLIGGRPAFSAESAFEVSVAPWLLLADDLKYGANPKVNVDLGYFVTEQIELQIGTVFGKRTKGTSEVLSGIYAGALYNFSEDHLRAFVLGGGVGYVNHYSPVSYEPDYPSATYVYARFGKRFLLSESWQITWFPYIEGMYGSRTGMDYLTGQINVFNFSILF